MSDYRQKLWVNIMEDLGPHEGCTVPPWLLLVYCLLFPWQGLKVLIDRRTGFDCLRLVWTIHGVDFSDRMFAKLATANGEVYRFTTVGKVVTIERVNCEVTP